MRRDFSSPGVLLEGLQPHNAGENDLGFCADGTVLELVLQRLKFMCISIPLMTTRRPCSYCMRKHRGEFETEVPGIPLHFRVGKERETRPVRRGP